MTKYSTKALDADLIAALECVAISYGQALEDANPKLANKAHDESERIYKELEMRGPSATSLILPLLHADHDWVRYIAAAYALNFDPVRAKEVLAELKAGRALGAMAYTTLLNWEMSHLKSNSEYASELPHPIFARMGHRRSERAAEPN